ncbi:MAG: hypothetical protein ABI361_13980 [Nitrososphaera sp.]|jgi:hypothetical protein
MGRTLPTITQILAYEYQNWKPFRQALNKAQKNSFDLMWDTASQHRLAMMYANRPAPIQSIMMAILFEHYRELLALTGRNGRGGQATTVR